MSWRKNKREGHFQPVGSCSERGSQDAEGHPDLCSAGGGGEGRVVSRPWTPQSSAEMDMLQVSLLPINPQRKGPFMQICSAPLAHQSPPWALCPFNDWVSFLRGVGWGWPWPEAAEDPERTQLLDPESTEQGPGDRSLVS